MNFRNGRNKTVALILAIVFIVMIIGCVVAVAVNGFPRTGDGTQIEQEDCDAEDRANREYAECGYIPPVKTTKPAPAKTPAKPNTRTTRR